MKTTITLTREDGAEISFALPSVSQSFTLSFPRGMALNDAARDVVRQSMKAEAERVAALFNGAPALLAASKALLASGSFAKHGEHGEKIAQEARAAIALTEGQTPATPARDTLGDTLAALERIAEMTCENTGRNFDEWGEAACFTDCVRIASECLASVKGRTQ